MSPASLPDSPSLPRILRYLTSIEDVQSCLKVNRRMHDVVSRNRHLLPRQEISLLVEYKRPKDTLRPGYSISAFLPNQNYNCFCSFSFREEESLPRGGGTPLAIRTFFEDPNITENGRVKSADECLKRLLPLFFRNFNLVRFRSGNISEEGKLRLVMKVFKRSRITCNTCCLNSNNELELAVILGSNKIEGKLSFDNSLLILNKKNMQFTIENCLSFNIGTLKYLLQEWYRGVRDSLHIYLEFHRHCRVNLDHFYWHLLDFSPTVLKKKYYHLELDMERKTDLQVIRISVRNANVILFIEVYQPTAA